jgi:cytochrome c556
VLDPHLAEELSRTLVASETLAQAIRDALREAEGDGGVATELLAARNSVHSELEHFEGRLEVFLDAVENEDAQLANVDLQNVLQKQQQTLQMMSNISKMLYDTATAVIRKIGA